jgi:hypothetical protein
MKDKTIEVLLKSIISGGKLQYQQTSGPDLLDSNNNETVKSGATASAVNEFTATNAATGTSPILGASGSDTHISIILVPKGTAAVIVDGPLASKSTVTTTSTNGAATYAASEIAGGLILRDPHGANRTDTTATAAQILAQFLHAKVGSTFPLIVRNTADAAETITVQGGTGVTISGTATIAQNNTKHFMGVFTNVTASSEAITLYSIGTFVH